MFRVIKNFIQEHRKRQNDILDEVRESGWANVYHDSIKGIRHLEQLPLNVGRWAGGYPLFYVLNRILKDYRPKKILELGLGESSKLIASYLANDLMESKHTIIEHDSEWFSVFNTRFRLSEQSKVLICPLVEKSIQSHSVLSYDGFNEKVENSYDLYVIDGPFGSKILSRFEIITLASKFTRLSEFVIIFDDYNRSGEQQTIKELFKILKEKQITVYKGIYVGKKRVLVLGTEKYKHISSL